MNQSAKRGVSSLALPFYLSLYFFFVVNLPLLGKLVEVIRSEPEVSFGFVISLPVFFIAVFNLLFTLFTVRWIAKPFFALLLTLSAVVSYVMFSYGLIVDSDMVRNAVETNYGEAVSYINIYSVAWVVVMGILPAVILWRTPIRYAPPLRELARKAVSVTASLAAIGLVALFFYKDYAAIGRNHKELNKFIIPTHYVYSIGKYVWRTHIREPIPWRHLGEDAVVERKTGARPQLLVLAIGETARAMNFELNGYGRDTNAFTRDLGVISFRDVSSCGTATALSVPCMFAPQGRKEFDLEVAKRQDSLMDVLARAGLEVFWMENDGGCKGVCDRVPHVKFRPSDPSPYCDGEYCRDEVILENLDEALARFAGKSGVLAVHLVGSHGPTYYQRYDEKLRYYQPDCPRSDIQNCSEEAIINTYDNTIRHEDFILAELIKRLQARSGEWDTALVYISDHGESLGENGVYLHGMPYFMAPKEQTQVPLLTWFSEGFLAGKGLDAGCLSQQAVSGRFSHDNLFDSVLGLMDVRTRDYRAERDLFRACRPAVELALQAEDKEKARN